MNIQRKSYQTYDHRLKHIVALSGNAKIFPGLYIPRTTANYWIKNGAYPVIHHGESLLQPAHEARIQILQNQLRHHQKFESLLKNMFSEVDIRSIWKNLSKDQGKRVSHILKSSSPEVPLNYSLKVLNISRFRYHSWIEKEKHCELSPTGKCQKLPASSLSRTEMAMMKELVTSTRYAHFPIRSLSYYAKRKGLLYCSPETWYKYINKYHWERPKMTKIQPKRKSGVRASQPNQIWHIDVSQFKLHSGKKYYIQAIIDNFSRYILTWSVCESIGGVLSAELLKKALRKVRSEMNGHDSLLYMDKGTENRNSVMTKTIKDSEFLHDVLARVDVRFSNSIVESLFRSLKNNHLYHHKVSTEMALKQQVGFYFTQHNNVMPHNAFHGATPREIFHKTWTEDYLSQLKNGQLEAIQKRKAENRQQRCSHCL